MAEPRALVRNAGSEPQVRRGARKEKDLSERRAGWLRKLMTFPEGRAFLASELARMNCFASVWHDHGSRMAYNVGRQDCGHELWVDAQDADPVAFELTLREWRMRDDKEARTDAAHDAGDENEERPNA